MRQEKSILSPSLSQKDVWTWDKMGLNYRTMQDLMRANYESELHLSLIEAVNRVIQEEW